MNIYCEVESRDHFDVLLILAHFLGLTASRDIGMLLFVYHDGGEYTSMYLDPSGKVLPKERTETIEWCERVPVIKFIAAMYQLRYPGSAQLA